MPTYNTPDVYVEEISTLPPSIAEVSTAIPAFIGYTETVTHNAKDLTNVPVRISSLLEYKSYFGGPYLSKFTAKVETVNSAQVVTITKDADKKHQLYYALDHFFRNGGGDCYIVSVGTYDKDKAADDFSEGLDALRNEDEPTLIILSEAGTLDNTAQYYGLCQQALQQCADLKDRFCIFDALPKNNQEDAKEPNTGIDGFRYRIGTNNLKYGAAYYPNLNTSLNYIYNDDGVTINGLLASTAATPSAPAALMYSKDLSGITVTYSGIAGDHPQVKVEAGTGSAIGFSIADKILTITNVGTDVTGALIADAWQAWTGAKLNFAIIKIGNGQNKVPVTPLTPLTASASPSATEQSKSTLKTIKDSDTGLYNLIRQELNKFMIVLPPAYAMAGVYAVTDRERGVWKAPANVSLNAVISPTLKITADDQESLNVDPTSGKSINAIRSFFGKGTLVWGARTLAGNDNEWRYISVRRLFNMIEESAKKASYFAVFESNDAATWLKVRGMIESFLYGLWQQGALAGSIPKAAYYVHVGLGTTMTPQDVLEGRMIIEIGLAAVRPAEFIVLKFSHKLQEA